MLVTLGVYEKIWGNEALGIDKALLISLVGILVVFVILGILAVFVVAMGKGFDRFNASKKPASKKSAAPKANNSSAPDNKPVQKNVAAAAPASYIGTALLGVTNEEAAVIMALTSDQTKIPLNRLVFNSIKNLDNPTGEPVLTNVSDEEAAVIMALTASKLNKPLNMLRFNSIKALEEI